MKQDPKIGNYWPSVYRIKNLLRSVRDTAPEKRQSRGFIIHSDRGSGKTTGLEQFVAERTLILPCEQKIMVVCPNTEICHRFEETFIENFPTLRSPVVVHFGAHQFGGRDDITEVYVEEIFLIPAPQVDYIRQHFGERFIAGVGTLERTTLINVVDW